MLFRFGRFQLRRLISAASLLPFAFYVSEGTGMYNKKIFISWKALKT